MRIRPAQSDDQGAIRTVLEAAFGGPVEADLVDKLRADTDIVAELVADEYGQIVAHILIYELEMTSNDRQTHIRAAALAPVAVAPTHHHLGIGSELVRQGLEKCEENLIEAVIAFNDAPFLKKFNFRTEYAKNIKNPFPGENMTIKPVKYGIFDEFFGFIILPDAFEKTNTRD